MTKSTTVLALAAARAEVTRLSALVKQERADAKMVREMFRAERIAAREVKATERAERKAARVAKLEAKLAALKSPVVGVKAMRANRRPSKVTVTQGASA
jgi:capsule polysaccharide export protein KpsE/RkpR